MWCHVIGLVVPGFQRHVHSLRSISHDRSVASSKPSSPKSAISCFLFQCPVSSHFLTIIQWLLMSSSSSSRCFYSVLLSVFKWHVLEGSTNARHDQPRYPSFFLLYVACPFSSLTNKHSASEMSATAHQMTQHHIPKGWNPHHSYLYHAVRITSV